VLVVGIDGLPPALLERLIVEGVTPNLARLVERGCSGILRSTPNYQSASAWTSMMTGVNPGVHGILHFTNPVRGSYGVEQIDARARRCRSIWSLLSEAGATVAALNVPVSYPAEPVNGIMLAGWLCPSPASPGFAHPPELAEEVARVAGDYPIHADVRRHASRGDFGQVARAAAHGITVKGEVACHLIERRRPDVAAVVFTECDSLQHWCWHILDAAHPLHDLALADRWRDDLLAVYQAADAQVAALIDAVGGDADVMIVSDHGQAPNSGVQVLLRPWLVAAGYLVPRRRSLPRRIIDRVVAIGFGLARRHAPARVKVALRARMPGLQTRAQAGVRAVAADRARTRAWTETGHVFVNERGRWPEGSVESGAEYEALLTEIEAELCGLRDADSGELVVEDVVRGVEAFHGPRADIMPDLLVRWRHERIVRALAWRGRTISHPSPPELPTGAHHPDGTLLAAGPSFQAEGDCPPHSICDIAPTVLHLAGCAVPTYMDGDVMSELLTAEAAKDVCRDAVKHPEDADGAAAAGDADDIVVGRLRSLGYIDQG